MVIIKNTKCWFLFLVALVAVVSFSCTSESGKTKSKEDLLEEQLEGEMSEQRAVSKNFRIPTPMEVFAFLKSNNSVYIQEAPNNPDNHKHYDTQKMKAINFGIYSADLAYCSVFDDFQNTITYFNVAKLLASELGLNEGFGNAMVQRFDDNLSNIDSLREIARESYFEANMFLDEQGLSKLLGHILVGSWIETLYLATETVKSEDVNSPNYERIADQRLLLNNLIAYLKVSDEENQNTQLISALKELSVIFDELNFNSKETQITQEQFVNISNKVTEIRNTYIR